MLKKLYLEPTNKCNLNCKMCFRHTWFDEPMCDLSLEQVRGILASMPSSVETIFFGGMGEPLFHKDICEMIRIAADTGAEVELLTNGTLLTETMIRQIMEAGLSRLWISIDELITETGPGTDAASGPPDHSGHGHTEKVLQNMRLLNQIRQNQLSSFSLGITFVAMRSNVHQLANLPYFISKYLVDEVNVSNIAPVEESSGEEMLYSALVDMYSGPGMGSVLPTVRLPMFDMNIPEVASGIQNLMKKQNFQLCVNDQPILRKAGYCKFVKEGMAFVRSDGAVAPCMALLHNGYTWLKDIRRKITHCSFGNIREQPLSEIWNSAEYKAFRKKFDTFDFAPCLYCGHCELFAENQQDCIGNSHPACGGCLWAEGVLNCP